MVYDPRAAPPGSDSTGLSGTFGLVQLVWARLGMFGLVWARPVSSWLVWARPARSGSSGLVRARPSLSGLIWARPGSSELIWATLARPACLCFSRLIQMVWTPLARLSSSGLVLARLGRPGSYGLVRARPGSSGLVRAQGLPKCLLQHYLELLSGLPKNLSKTKPNSKVMTK